MNLPGGLHNARCTTLPRPLVRFRDAAILTATRLFRLCFLRRAVRWCIKLWPSRYVQMTSAISNRASCRAIRSGEGSSALMMPWIPYAILPRKLNDRFDFFLDLRTASAQHLYESE